MSQHWYEKAAERALQSPLKDYERRDLSKAYRFSLHGLHFGLLPDERASGQNGKGDRALRTTSTTSRPSKQLEIGIGRPFAKGRSGNPAGRPRGARNKTTMAVEALLDGEAEAITRKALEKAKEGDAAALRLCLERIIPARKDRHVSFSLPPLNCAADSMAACGRHSWPSVGTGRGRRGEESLGTHWAGLP